MQELIEQQPATFQDRRQTGTGSRQSGERRQFVDSRETFRPEVLELAEAIDQYKLRHRRRFITFEELFDVVHELGYRKIEGAGVTVAISETESR